MNKNFIVLGVVILLGIGGYAFTRSSSLAVQSVDQNPTQSKVEPVASTTPVGVQSKEATFTSADVTMHADANSCYTSIRGNVYDLTSWINQHPGGKQAIMSICGKDGTSVFEGQHGGRPRPERELDGFKIGILAK